MFDFSAASSAVFPEQKKFSRIIYCLPGNQVHVYQDLKDELYKICPDIFINEGLPDIERLDLNHDKEPKLLLIDDLARILEF